MAKFEFTKRMAFAKLAEMVEGVEAIPVAEGEVAISKADMLDFINHEVELLNRKSNHTGNTKSEKEMAERMDVVKNALAEIGKPARVSEIVAHIGQSAFSPNRVTAILGKMAGTKKAEGTGEVVRTVEKGVAYFALAE